MEELRKLDKVAYIRFASRLPQLLGRRGFPRRDPRGALPAGTATRLSGRRLRPRVATAGPVAPSRRRRPSIRRWRPPPSGAFSPSSPLARLERCRADRRQAEVGRDRLAGRSRSSISAGACRRRRARSKRGREFARCARPRSPWPPKARASAAKSGLRSVGADYAPRILALLVHADRAVHAVVDDEHHDRPAPYCTAVASSCPVIRKSPSPAKQTTVRSGCTILAATAAGTP